MHAIYLLYAYQLAVGKGLDVMRQGKTEIKVLDPSQIFRPEELIDNSGWSFRIFDEKRDDPKMKQVFNTYKQMHQQQYGSIRKVDDLVDESDPDIDLPNIIHAYQTAEMIREKHPDLDWFHLTGFIHDLGGDGILRRAPGHVGTLFPVGCAFADSIVFRDSTFQGNPDLHNKKIQHKYGMYEPHCGLKNVMMSWGHDEYMYQVLKHNGTTLPEEALHVIRYHSFYPWHCSGDYKHLTNNEDEEILHWIKEFNKFDLYTKRESIPDMEKLEPYYQGLIDKYIPGKLEW
ncbi:Inositol oxygenase [Armadillidium vulgare]|nr:Inositol oxygenase [Armadillidium vulgare]